MSIAWNEFTPGLSLVGGLVVGLATALYLLGDGRIAGISGVVGGMLRAGWHGVPLRREAARWAFVGGLLVAPWVWRFFAPLPAVTVDVGPGAVVAAGLLVGFGTRMGQGCTSGHGVCGLSQFSLRSLVNVLAFIGAGAVMVALLRHV